MNFFRELNTRMQRKCMNNEICAMLKEQGSDYIKYRNGYLLFHSILKKTLD